MKPRINYEAESPELLKKLLDLSLTSNACSLEQNLVHLVHIRASQMNGCAFCLDMHTKQAKIHGERELRLYHLPIWRESTLFTNKERAALEWTELVTELPEHGISQESYDKAREQLTEKEMSDLTFVISVINFWNRLGVSSPKIPGSLDSVLGLTKANLG